MAPAGVTKPAGRACIQQEATCPDRVGLDEFYATTSRAVVAQVYAMVGDLSEAEDALAEAYARAWQRWHGLRDYADPAGRSRCLTAGPGARNASPHGCGVVAEREQLVGPRLGDCPGTPNTSVSPSPD